MDNTPSPNIVSIFGEPLDHASRNVRPIAPEQIARIMGERVDLYEALREAPEECRGREGWLLVVGIIGALSWLGVLWLLGAF